MVVRAKPAVVLDCSPRISRSLLATKSVTASYSSRSPAGHLVLDALRVAVLEQLVRRPCPA